MNTSTHTARRYRAGTVNVQLSVPAGQLATWDEAAKRAGESRSAWVRRVCDAALRHDAVSTDTTP